MDDFFIGLIVGNRCGGVTNGHLQRAIIRVAIAYVQYIAAANGNGRETQTLYTGTRDNLCVPQFSVPIHMT